MSTSILIIEPYYGGSHRALIDGLVQRFQHKLITLPAKKWHWRARCSAITLYNLIPDVSTEKILFCSSVLNLAELLGLKPELHQLKKIVYFHENQLIYPKQQIKERDIQYAYNQITTCLSADVVLFNSEFNKNSLLSNVPKIIKMLPDCRPKNIQNVIEKKSKVVYFPINFPTYILPSYSAVLHILWPHRWEFDKDPEAFFNVLFQLKNMAFRFKLSVLGENFKDNPKIFSMAQEVLSEEIVNFGFLEKKEDYYEVLRQCHVVVSTSRHEFFGVAMMEATYCGCFPLAPNNLVYPEFYPPESLYSNQQELYARLSRFCSFPNEAITARKQMKIDFEKYACDTIMKQFSEIFNICI